jgi:hypothetical protein
MQATKAVAITVYEQQLFYSHRQRVIEQCERILIMAGNVVRT